MASASFPTLSIIICTYRRADILDITLRTLAERATDHGSWELLIIDNNSPDDTAERSRAFLDEHPGIRGRYLLETSVGLSYARNRGIREAAADWILYLDDDVLVDPDLIARTLERVKEDRYPIIGGVYDPWYHYGRPRWYRDSYVSNRRPGVTELRHGTAYYAAGCIMLWKKSLLESLGGFDPRVGMTGDKIAYGEDDFIQYQAIERGVLPAYDPGMRIEHLVPLYKQQLDWFFISYFAGGRDFVGGDQLPGGAGPIIKQMLIGIGVTIKDLLLNTPKLLLRREYYVENWLIDCFRKLAKRTGIVYTALLREYGSPAPAAPAKRS